MRTAGAPPFAALFAPLFAPLIASLVALLLAGCASAPTRLRPVTEAAQASAAIADIPGARYWGDGTPAGVEGWLQASEDEIRAAYGGVMGVPHHYLAISGGGADGAFGAGLLVGWTEHGSRPEFTVVTGISTGALIAPFAFLGARYDAQLTRVYTELSTRDLVERRGLFEILRNDSLASTRPLRKLISEYFDDAFIAELAREHRRGRSLLIGTTNLDAARPVTWNITRIAASGAPGARDLIHDVILASASIPGVFPPVPIEVESGGQRYDELHVDGGVTSQVFIYPTGLNWRKVLQRLQVPGRPKLYVIRNSPTAPGFRSVHRRLVPIMSRTVSSLIRTQGIGDMTTIYFLTRRDGVDFHLAHVPDDFDLMPTETFDRAYMRALFELGRNAARGGYRWVTGPQTAD
jgi:predicted acylesterase/phospholipase RssA